MMYRVTGSYWCHTHNEREQVFNEPIGARSDGDAIFQACESVQDDDLGSGHDWYEPEWEATRPDITVTVTRSEASAIISAMMYLSGMDASDTDMCQDVAATFHTALSV